MHGTRSEYASFSLVPLIASLFAPRIGAEYPVLVVFSVLSAFLLATGVSFLGISVADRYLAAATSLKTIR